MLPCQVLSPTYLTFGVFLVFFVVVVFLMLSCISDSTVPFNLGFSVTIFYSFAERQTFAITVKTLKNEILMNNNDYTRCLYQTMSG